MTFPLTRLVNREQLSQWFKLPQSVVAFESAQKDILELFKRALGDAPLDGLTYGRKSGAWAPAVEEAPTDGKTYGRKNSRWAPVEATSGGQVPIQFKDEGVNLGAAGTVSAVDVVGQGLSASRVSDEVRVVVNQYELLYAALALPVQLWTSANGYPGGFTGIGISFQRLGIGADTGQQRLDTGFTAFIPQAHEYRATANAAYGFCGNATLGNNVPLWYGNNLPGNGGFRTRMIGGIAEFVAASQGPIAMGLFSGILSGGYTSLAPSTEGSNLRDFVGILADDGVANWQWCFRDGISNSPTLVDTGLARAQGQLLSLEISAPAGATEVTLVLKHVTAPGVATLVGTRTFPILLANRNARLQHILQGRTDAAPTGRQGCFLVSTASFTSPSLLPLDL